jgi:hypothetical protein
VSRGLGGISNSHLCYYIFYAPDAPIYIPPNDARVHNIAQTSITTRK